MHEFSAATRRVLDVCTILLGCLAGITLEQVATTVTIAAGVMSLICGGIRVFEFICSRRGV